MDSSAKGIFAVVTAVVALAMCIWIFMLFFNSINLPLSQYGYGSDAINFTVNNTYYPFAVYTADSRAYTSGTVNLYYLDNATYAVPAAMYTHNSTHIKIYTNTTVGCSSNSVYTGNVTANCNLYARDYIYYGTNVQANSAMTNLTNNSWSAIVILSIVVILIAVGGIFMYLGIGKKQQ